MSLLDEATMTVCLDTLEIDGRVDGVDRQALIGGAEGDLLVEYQGHPFDREVGVRSGIAVETTVLPTLRKAIVVVPVEPAQMVVDVDLTAWSVIVGAGESTTVASATEALAVDLPGKATVVTLAHSTCAVTSPAICATHGVDVVDDDVVEMAPVSGIGATLMYAVPNRVAFADSP